MLSYALYFTFVCLSVLQAIVRNQDEYPCAVAMTPDNILLNINQDVVSCKL
jgi:DNA-directed RNA polymerase subunit E'/Rpb7